MPKSLQQEQWDLQHAKDMEVVTRELKRRSLDTIRVYNPLDKTFSFMYDRYWHRVPAKSYRDFPRYLARIFFKRICDEMIGQQMTKKGEELKALREQQMGHQYLDKYEENVEVWDRTPRLNDPDLVAQIRDVVLVGIVEEYGADEPEVADELPSEAPQDFRSMHEQLFDAVDRQVPKDMEDMPKPSVVSPKPMPKAVEAKVSKEELAKEVLGAEDTN